ncbi:hypothetical protein [Paenibacillus arenilitoris]|uniref:Uncharacterized protein n=1 Tax=Paenibacillus arenilitoris TaxID=2772299 RepID=A0A927CLH7_9BACL|nr:hypothetical protein [Paenibacillus arenilitoris]MBD2870239.1 hypothetical protein [Paenibacillus arenilitoris]
MNGYSEPLSGINENSMTSDCKIGSMEIFRMDAKWFGDAIPERDRACMFVIFKISGGGVRGWSESILPCTKQTMDITHWAAVFMRLKGLSIPDAVLYAQGKNEAWGQDRMQLALAALSDLAGTLQSRPSGPRDVDASLERSYMIGLSQAYFSF